MSALMAAANAWGLLLCTGLLGYGLVEVPRTIWKCSDTVNSLNTLEKKASKVKEEMVDAEAELYEVARVTKLMKAGTVTYKPEIRRLRS